MWDHVERLKDFRVVVTLPRSTDASKRVVHWHVGVGMEMGVFSEMVVVRGARRALQTVPGPVPCLCGYRRFRRQGAASATPPTSRRSMLRSRELPCVDGIFGMFFQDVLTGHVEDLAVGPRGLSEGLRVVAMLPGST